MTTEYTEGAIETIDDSVQRVKDNLGGREKGYIGDTPINDAVFQALQEAQNTFLQRYDPISLKRTVQTTVDTDSRDVVFYRIQEDGVYFGIKSIDDVRCREASEERGFRLRPMMEQNRQRLYTGGPEYTGSVGRPSRYMWNKKYNSEPFISLYPYPNAEYEIACTVNVYPVEFTPGTELKLDLDWLMALEALATSKCYFKLGELEDGTFWRTEYFSLARRIAGQEHRELTKQMNAVNQGSSINHEGTDPFVYNNEAPQW